MEIKFYQYFGVPPVSACPILATCTSDRRSVARLRAATIRARIDNGIRRV
jgi:hypothetical protein